MRIRQSNVGLVLLVTLVLLVGVAIPTQAQAAGPVFVEIVADQDRTSPDPLEPFDIRFIVHANGNKIQGMVFGLLFEFSNGNNIGTIDWWPQGEAQVIPSPQTVSAFESIAWNTNYGNGTDPDTLLFGLTSFSAPWGGAGEVFRIHVTPNDTGLIQIVYPTLGIIFPAHAGINILDPLGASLSRVVICPPIHVPPKPDPVRFRMATSSGTDTLFMGVPGTIYFNVDAAGNEIAGLQFVLEWDFTNGNFVGDFSDATGEVEYSPLALGAFESIAFNDLFPKGTDPDTSLLGFVSFGGDAFTGDDWVWAVTFEPTDTGTVMIDTGVWGPPTLSPNVYAIDELGSDLPSNFIPGRIVVLPCPYDNMGDVNQDGLITSSDLIYFVNYVFKSGPDPLPHRSVGDVNCSGGLGGADIIYLVNHVFKGGAPPCACIVRRI